MKRSQLAGARVYRRAGVEVVSVRKVEWLPRSPLSGLPGLVRVADGGLLYVHEYLLAAEPLVLDVSRSGWASYLLVTSYVAAEACWLDVLVGLWSAWVEPQVDGWRYPLFVLDRV